MCVQATIDSNTINRVVVHARTHTHNKTSKLHKTHMPIEKNTKTAKMYEL